MTEQQEEEQLPKPVEYLGGFIAFVVILGAFIFSLAVTYPLAKITYCFLLEQAHMLSEGDRKYCGWDTVWKHESQTYVWEKVK